MLIDSHANLHGETYAGELNAVFERAAEAGVKGIVAMCCRLQEFEKVLEIAKARKNVWATIGAHPHHAKDRPDITSDWLIETAQHPKVIAIGETGLDQYYNHSPLDVQIRSFRAHIEAARETGLPIVIHCRDSDAEMADILEKEMGKGAFKALLHSYTGGHDLARRAAALGAYFSVNGIASFNSAKALRAVIREDMPRERIIIETDCPYLTPVPHRGKRNEPAYLPHVAANLAEILDVPEGKIIQSTGEAFFKLFGKAELA